LPIYFIEKKKTKAFGHTFDVGNASKNVLFAICTYQNSKEEVLWHLFTLT